MSGAAEGSAVTTKAVVSDPSSSEPAKEQQKPTAALEEDDEFEDFPVEDWGPEDTDVPKDNTHLWEESWDDDDTSEDFSAQLKWVAHDSNLPYQCFYRLVTVTKTWTREELKKVEANKRG
ncbi:MAG: hypothetical protein M1833_005386 [Piccolia ochrophora]|nr:MAG: hypothetical protein M1833_005386 [Piccolia ochrophora]